MAESFTPELRSGEVRALMNDWELPMMNLFAVFPAGRLASAKARAFALVCRAVHDRKAAGDGSESIRRSPFAAAADIDVPASQVLAASPAEGLVLRYGRLYGPGSAADAPPPAPAVHVDAAANAALRAIDHGEPGLFNIADPSDAVSTQKAMAQLGWRADFRIEAK